MVGRSGRSVEAVAGTDEGDRVLEAESSKIVRYLVRSSLDPHRGWIGSRRGSGAHSPIRRALRRATNSASTRESSPRGWDGRVGSSTCWVGSGASAIWVGLSYSSTTKVCFVGVEIEGRRGIRRLHRGFGGTRTATRISSARTFFVRTAALVGRAGRSSQSPSDPVFRVSLIVAERRDEPDTCSCSDLQPLTGLGWVDVVAHARHGTHTELAASTQPRRPQQFDLVAEHCFEQRETWLGEPSASNTRCASRGRLAPARRPRTRPGRGSSARSISTACTRGSNSDHNSRVAAMICRRDRVGPASPSAAVELGFVELDDGRLRERVVGQRIIDVVETPHTEIAGHVERCC